MDDATRTPETETDDELFSDVEQEAPSAGGDDELEPDKVEPEVDLDDLVLEEEGRSEYDYSAINRRLAEDGVWKPLPKLGKDAEGQIARAGNERFSELWSKAVRKYGNKSGNIPIEKRAEIVPVIYAKSILLGIRNVRLLDRETRRPVSSVTVDVRSGSTWTRKTFTFTLDGEGYIQNTERNRLTLLRLFSPGLQDDCMRISQDDSNYLGTDSFIVDNVRDEAGKA